MPDTPNSMDSTAITTGNVNYATVTMMLAERMARSDWSVDDEHFFETNTMNVWQTLEFLSNLNLRKRYHYEGYHDTENRIRTLTPSWRRDSFVEKNASPNEDANLAFPIDSGKNRNNVTTPVNDGGTMHDVSAVAINGRPASNEFQNDKQNLCSSAKERKTSGQKRRKRLNRKKDEILDLDPEYALNPADFTDLIKCNFNLPRITTILERLMGTNIVRLTDREYMRTLRDRIDEDYRNQLEKRIKTREQREIERERLLIIEGKSSEVPRELFHDPIFVVNREVEQEILFQRSKVKTSKEKNAIRLRQATAYWERERQIRDIEEKQREEKVMNRINNEKMLEEQYQVENDERGMDLLRYIYSPRGRSSANWRPCEMDLKEYLETERAKMKARENVVSKQFNSDPKDLRNVIAARKAKLRAEHEAKIAATTQAEPLSETSRSKIFEMGKYGEAGVRISGLDGPSGGRGKFPGDSDETIMSDDFEEDEGSTLSESVRAHAEMLDDEISQDIKRGFIISRAQYEDLRYEEVKITKLRQARNINELYQLAEEIILGDRPVEEDLAEEEQEEEVEEEVEEEESTAESY